MNRQNTRQHNKKFTKNFNNKTAPKQDEHFLDFFKPGVEVRGGDVNKALRVLKKRLERADFQKELAKQAFYEKPSIKRKRKKQQAKKRWERHVRDAESSGEMRQYEVTGTKWMKSKRKSRKVREAKERHLQRQRSTGYY